MCTTHAYCGELPKINQCMRNTEPDYQFIFNVKPFYLNQMITIFSMTEHVSLCFCTAEDKKRMETFGGPKLHGSAMVPVIYIVPCGNGKSFYS